MSAGVTSKPLMTLAEFEALPDDGVERWLIDGVLWENGATDKTKRNRFHSVAEGRVTKVLGVWLDAQPEPRGEVVCGEVGFRLRRNPDSGVGIDVAYVSPEMAAADPPDTAMYDGPPVLAVEILSPNDTQKETAARIRTYLTAGVQALWVIDTDLRTVTVYKPGTPPAVFGDTQVLTAGPELPGFSARVADFFR